MSTVGVTETKIDLRHRIKLARREVDDSWIAEAGAAAQDRAINLQEFDCSIRVGCYMAMPKETGTNKIIRACRELGKSLFLPVFDQENRSYQFTEAEAEYELIPGPLGILEPAQGRRLDASELDLVFVPGLAFDKKGNRLGHGAGYYDRLLANAQSVFKVGLAFEFQMMESVVAHEHDVAMSAVITNARVIRVVKQDKR